MKRNLLVTLGITASLLLSACSAEPKDFAKEDLQSSAPNGVYYEIFVRSFADGDGNGIGDFKGATAKLDYLQELGIEGIWLMPINPSPSYHGYDVTNYKDINPDYGTLEDFQTFVDEAHKRGIKVVMDFVVNHTSKEHPWFQKAVAGDPDYANYYNFANASTNINALGEWGQSPVWHGAGNKKYEGIFWDGMPDLNFDNPLVRLELIKAGTFWIKDMGVDGFRLDAAKHIYSSNVENDEEKDHEWWAEFNTALKKHNPDVFLVGEVWDNASVVAPYLEEGLTSAFNFDTSAKIISSAQDETDSGIASDLESTREYFKSINKNYIDSTFITNHDMDRIMTQVDGDTNKAKMAASILLTIPGNPFIYYGEEIGMLGKKPDEYIREPFIWETNQDGTYETSWMTAFESTDRQTLAVENQMKDENSLYHHYKELIHVRRSSDVLISGEIKSTPLDKPGLVMFERLLDKESLFVVHNMTGKTNSLDLNEKFFEGYKEYKDVYFSTNDKNRVKKAKIQLEPYSTVILGKK